MTTLKRLLGGFSILCLTLMLASCGGGEAPRAPSQSISIQTLSDVPSIPVGQGPYDQQVQEMYIAYYGRPADPCGLAYSQPALQPLGAA
jgi:hypothetical protein